MSKLNNLWGVDADDSSLQSKSGGKFGLNTAVFSCISYTDKAGKDESEAHAVDINVMVGEKEFRRRLYFNLDSELFVGNNKVKPGEEGYDDALASDLIQKIALTKQALEGAGVTKDTIAAVSATFAQGIENVIENIKKLVALAPADITTKSVDVFLEYQWNISEGQDRTFLEIPKNVKGGRVFVPATTPVGKWTEVRDEEKGLSYVDDAGNKHPFSRSKDYMASNKAIQQGVGSTSNSSISTPAQTSQKSTWD